MSRRLAALATIVALILVTPQPPASSHASNEHVIFGATDLAAESVFGVDVDGGALILSNDATLADGPSPSRFGSAESAPWPLAGPSAVRGITVDADMPAGAETIVEVRGLRAGRWSEWHPSAEAVALTAVGAVQVRVTLLASAEGWSPRLHRVSATIASGFASAAEGPDARPVAMLWATRLGLVGRTTANGHVIKERDRFVALPSRRGLNRRDGSDYTVRLSYHGRSVVAPVWDIGPWNTKDDFWNTPREQFTELTRWMPQAEAAFFGGHNGGRDATGRFVTIPASIDLADGTFWDDLGMGPSDWVEVSFLWVDAPSPPPRATPHVEAKLPPGGAATRGAAPQPRAVSYNAPSPASRVYLPLVIHQPSGWATEWTIQNASAEPARGATVLYAPDGARVAALPFELPPFGSATLHSRMAIGVAEGFVGSAVITATAPIAVVVTQDRRGFDSMAYEGLTAGAPAVAAPLLFKEHGGWSTGLQVQNLGSTTSIVEITYAGASGSWSESDEIPPLASHTFYQAANTDLPAGFAGSAMVRSRTGQSLGAVVNAVRADGAAMAYPGLTGGAERLEVPLLFKRYQGWDTGLRLFNLGSAPAPITVLYLGTPNAWAEPALVNAGSSATFYQPANRLLPNGYVGAATVIGPTGGRLVGITNEVRAGAPAAMNYVVGQLPAAALGVPLVMKDVDGWNTGIQVQNPNGSSVVLAIVFYDSQGKLVHRIEEGLAASGTRTYYAPSIGELPAGFRGSATLQSLDGQPLAAIVNMVSE